uniref:Uncharacterized protein n=1 Tax=Peronospora matthiolae TaxID=2874970 RepID=A0AAV1VIH5_9STRA
MRLSAALTPPGAALLHAAPPSAAQTSTTTDVRPASSPQAGNVTGLPEATSLAALSGAQTLGRTSSTSGAVP